jgi:hypothetical protein
MGVYPMMAGTRIFVIFVFAIIGVAFLSMPAALIFEFGGANPLEPDADWLAIATLYSHHFLFFPVLGIFTLAAFYIPACVFVDMYWRVVRFGRARLFIGTLVLAGLSYQVAGWLQDGAPALWQFTPAALQQDQGSPEICGPYQAPAVSACTNCSVAPKQAQTVCRSRQPLLKSLRDLRDVSQSSIGLAPFVRICERSPLIEPSSSQNAQRYCFVSGNLTDADTCCAAQRDFNATLAELYTSRANRSMLDTMHRFTLPVFVFFMLILLVIGGLLVMRRMAVDTYYSDWVIRLERGVILGALAMIIWPLANHAFVASSAVLYGTEARSTYVALAPFFSALFGLWALMILFYFYRKADRDAEGAGKALGLLLSVLTVLNYSAIISYAERYIGAGAGWEALLILPALLLLAASGSSFLKLAKRSAFSSMGRN